MIQTLLPGGSAQVVATQLQAQTKQKQRLLSEGRPADHVQTGAWGVMRQLYEEGGLAAFWKGA